MTVPLNKLIYLTGSKLHGYTVITNGFDGCTNIYAPSVRVGNAVVRALREEAHKRPDLFPPSAHKCCEQNNQPNESKMPFSFIA
jgi:hypothetical protein